MQLRDLLPLGPTPDDLPPSNCEGAYDTRAAATAPNMVSRWPASGGPAASVLLCLMVVSRFAHGQEDGDELT
jgi:hypothetical protein